LREVRRVARAMEFDTQIPVSRAPRFIKEPYRTLIIFDSERKQRPGLLARENTERVHPRMMHVSKKYVNLY